MFLDSNYCPSQLEWPMYKDDRTCTWYPEILALSILFSSLFICPKKPTFSSCLVRSQMVELFVYRGCIKIVRIKSLLMPDISGHYLVILTLYLGNFLILNTPSPEKLVKSTWIHAELLTECQFSSTRPLLIIHYWHEGLGRLCFSL